MDFERGIKINVFGVNCSKINSTNLAVNSDAGKYKFTINAELNVKISCQFAASFYDEKTPLRKDCILDSIKCNSHCTTIDGPDHNKPCIFPFVWKGKLFKECTDIGHPGKINSTGLFCATEIDIGTKEMKKWGKCSGTCGYCYGTPINQTRNDDGKKSSCEVKKVIKIINLIFLLQFFTPTGA